MAFRSWPFFCEENVWHLCADEGIPAPVGDRKVIVISGPRGRVAMRHQREGRGRPVLWDYHVVLGARGLVWDLDTTLGLPVDLDRWRDASFKPPHPLFPPRFRIVDAATFRATFASDRSHMTGPNGRPLKPPPPWPPIGAGMTLPRFLDLDDPFVGTVVDLDGLNSI